MSNWDFALRLLVAIASGMGIGLERELRKKSAGLRTNTIVSIGAAIYVMLSLVITEDSGASTRIIGQVVTGVGFLGGGIIFKEGVNVRGLTTAATVWCSAAVGSLAGAGYFMFTLIAALIIIGINWILMPVDKWLSGKDEKKSD